MISFEDVSFCREERMILKHLNWHVASSENWVILGLNGSGKTTLLQLMTGYLWPSSGKLTILGEVFGQTSIPTLRRRIGWVSSALQTELRPKDLAEDIVLSGKFASVGLWEATTTGERQQAQAVLAACGGAGLLGKPYQVLSQGERQLVLIARALMAEPELLILDEPCNGLDLFARERLLAQISQLASNPNGPRLLFVTHHTEEIPAGFDQLLLLKEGEIFQQGPLDQLLTTEVLTEFYQEPIELVSIRNQRVAVYPK